MSILYIFGQINKHKIYDKIKYKEEYIMKKLIACCGLDCEKCDAYIATINNDQTLREKTAKLWSKLNNTTIAPDMINCTGCRMEGIKTIYCSNICQIRKCVKNNGFDTCAQCQEIKTCDIVAQIHKHSKDALKNLGQ